MVVERVVGDAEHVLAQHGPDGLHRLTLGAKAADIEAQRLDEPDDSGILQHRLQRGQRTTDIGLTVAVTAAVAIVDGH